MGYIVSPELKATELELHETPVKDWAFPKILTFIPLERAVSYADTVLPWIAQMAQHGHRFIWGEYTATTFARNKAAFQLLQSDFTHILMLDLDHNHPVDIAERLARWVVMYPEIKVIGGLNFGRRPPYTPCVSIRGDKPGEWLMPTAWDKDVLMEVNMLGTGSILINREVFEDIEPVWFTNDYSLWEVGRYMGEDTVFSQKCEANGIKLWCDTSITSPHLDYIGIDDQTFRSYYSENGLQVLNKRAL